MYFLEKRSEDTKLLPYIEPGALWNNSHDDANSLLGAPESFFCTVLLLYLCMPRLFLTTVTIGVAWTLSDIVMASCTRNEWSQNEFKFKAQGQERYSKTNGWNGTAKSDEWKDSVNGGKAWG
ncbi:hypothetical protein J6590_027750 [Homalodisca vitripennis]|nr:hypothetical protein J6590_027750 [Homalodisca vitripennis]